MQSEQDLMQTLADSGCDAKTVERICGLFRAGFVEDAIRGLRTIRCGLMDELHKSQSRVDCLDYLVYQLQRETAETRTTK